MIIGPILEIIGILFTALGSILALTKLWEEHIEKSKKWAGFLAKCGDDLEKYVNESLKKDNEYLLKVKESNELHPKFIEYIEKSTQLHIEKSIKNKEKMNKRIASYYFLDRNLLYLGVSLIVIGTILQISGVISCNV